MYLSKKQVAALDFAKEALLFGVENNIQPEESGKAFDVIDDMLQRANFNPRSHAGSDAKGAKCKQWLSTKEPI